MAVITVWPVCREERTVNDPVVDPAGIVRLAGVEATSTLLLWSVILAPPAGAGPVSVTLPVDDLPRRMVLGLTETEESVTATALIVSEAVLLVPL